MGMIYDDIDIKDKLYQWLPYAELPEDFGTPLIPRGAGLVGSVEDFKKQNAKFKEDARTAHKTMEERVLAAWKNTEPDANGNKPEKPDVPKFDENIYDETTGLQELQSMTSEIKDKVFTNSFANKLYLITLDNTPYEQEGYKDTNIKEAKTFTDLCLDESGIPGLNYDADDFLYVKKLGYSLNRMITLRRFPFACTDNIWEPLSSNNMGVLAHAKKDEKGETIGYQKNKSKIPQEEQDICRMVTYYNEELNKLDDLLSFSYGLRWKNLQAGMEANRMVGDQEGLSGFMNKVAAVSGDEDLIRNRIMGENQLEVDPTFDSNKVHGPVDCINETHIRDIGFDFNKEFDITFEYTLRSIGTRTPEYAMKDILANILCCTYNDGDFWGGARYWTGKRPSRAMSRFKWMNTSRSIDDVLTGAYSTLRAAIQSWQSDPKGSALNLLKNIIKGSVGAALGKIMDAVGRPGIVISNSLLSGEPVGEWHLTIGNPYNPILSMGDLICTNVQINFPTDSLSYGEFPTCMTAKVTLKPSKPRDRAGIEMMFNHGKSRMYWAPKQLSSTRSVKGKVSHYERKDISLNDYKARLFDPSTGVFHSDDFIDKQITTAFKYCDDRVKLVSDEIRNIPKYYDSAKRKVKDKFESTNTPDITVPNTDEISGKAIELTNSVSSDVSDALSKVKDMFQ